MRSFPTSGSNSLLILAVLAVAWTCSDRACPAAEKTAHTRKPLPSAAEIAKLPADGGKEFNRLIHEKSPYLLQHARNPVNWYPWGPEALARAKKEGKPIFMSVGYSTCHWCHVMERESFETEAVAAILNEFYIAIKVDREERPDLDQIYMTATQMLSGHGGWPNSLWLTPAGKPWYAGTYFPPNDKFGRPGFKKILNQLARAWTAQNAEILKRSDEIAARIKRYTSGKTRGVASGELSYKLLENATKIMSMTIDPKMGGFGRAPKFPPHSSLQLLLGEYARTRNDRLMKMSDITLGAMADGGIHDHIGGGFHRYATDPIWLLPHFEKMLYDNAQLARAYAEAYGLTGKERYKRVAMGIYKWVLREMTDRGGGFYSALDADSAGEEGLFYVWTRKEVVAILGEKEGSEFCKAYGFADGGNFVEESTGKKTGANIPHVPIGAKGDDKRFATARDKLLARRVKRIWPYKDDKILTSWNGLMIESLACGGRIFKDPKLTAAAEKAAGFVLKNMRKNGRLLRTYRNGSAKLNAYLDDYAFLGIALVELHRTTGDKKWLTEAASLADTMLKHYADPQAGGFFFTSSDHEELLSRTKDPFDRAVPSGNAVAVRLLVELGDLTGQAKYRDAAGKSLKAFLPFMERSPRGLETMLHAAGRHLETAPPEPEITTRPAADAVAKNGPVKIEAFAKTRTASPGESIDLVILITIDKGWHVNSNKPLAKGLIATALKMQGGKTLKLTGVGWPKAKEAKFGFADQPLSVYEGVVRVAANIKIAADHPLGPVKAVLTLTAQPCSNTACLAPVEHKLPLAINIVKTE
ncbi:MAG: DUF255 domain-containing protein [Phycisphaerales bacterium]|nr:DUF255 domain-containing protein [Phycisphaerales bacterium]